MTILVVGDANVDLVLRGDVVPRFGQAEQLLDSADLTLGSSAGIVAHGLARLGVPTALAATVGNDEFGRLTRHWLTEAGVDVSPLGVHPTLPTGLSVILSAPADRSILTLLGSIPTLTGDAVLAATSGVSHVHFASYFLLPGLAAELPTVLRTLRALGVTTSLDTNWDPAEQWAGLAAVLPLVDILMPNLEELRAIAGAVGVTGDSDEDLARGVAALGPRVVTKVGREGGWSVAADSAVVRAPGLVLDARDSTGAGDSFDAGYLAAVASGVTSESERVRWATVAGSLSTRAAGGTPAQATLSELTAHLA
ncbi:carbohydrate kinase family protein [Lacisediminihabitans sp. FW035]